MRKNAETEDTGKMPEPLEAAKPKRGRKPRAEKTEGNPEGKEDAGEAGEHPEERPEEPEGTPEKPQDHEREGEPGMGMETAGEPEKAEDAEMPPAPVMPTQVIDSPLKLMKQEFAERSQVIKEQMRNIQNAFITIGFQLHWIRENNMYRVLNYKNVYEYAEKEYGIKKTTCCNFISIVENYADRDENGNVVESIADCYRNYSASQLVAMLGMPDELKQQVSPDMSVRAINRLRKGEPEEPPAVEMENPAEGDALEKGNALEPQLSAGDAPATEEGAEPEKESGNITDESPEEPAAEDHNTHAERMEEAGKNGNTEEEPEEAAGDMEEDPEGIPDGTLAEIDSYNDYRSMADELDLIMRHVFSVDAPVRVKIVCVQG